MSDRIVCTARAWLGTPYIENHYPLRGVGCDCASLLLGIMMDIGLAPACTPLPAYAQDRHLHRSDEAYVMALTGAGFAMLSRAEISPGDIALFVMGGRQPASHSAIITEVAGARPSRMLHAYKTVGKVAENLIDERWLARLRFAFRFPS